MIVRILLVSALFTSAAFAEPAHPVAKPDPVAKPGPVAKPWAVAKPGPVAKTGAAKPVPVVQPPRHGTPTHRAPAHHAAPAPTQAPDPVVTTPAVPAEPAKGSNTGLPLPRFASLRGEEVNLRSGPGTRYPIEWVYKRRDLPVEIEREFEVWRLVQDQEGVKGWVHQAVLVGRRSFVVTAAERTVRADPKDDAVAVAALKPGVIGRIRSCDATADWCQVQVQDYHGWLKRTDFWGIYPGEAIQ